MAVVVYADIAEVKSLKPPKTPPPKAKRDKITSFSRKSRKRMIRKVAKIRDLESSIFVTLTYPGKFDFTPQQIKQHFFAFKRRFFRKYTTEGIIWRLELKTRLSGASEGEIAPHFHLVIVHKKFISITDMVKFVRFAWNDIVAPGDADHFKAGTRVELISSRSQVMGYVSKTLGYVEKTEDQDLPEDAPQNWGRYWGTCGKLDMRPMIVVIVDYEQFRDLRRVIARSMKSAEYKRIVINKKIGKSTKRKRYYRRIVRGGKQRGFAVLGYGDQSKKAKILQESVIWKIITASNRFALGETRPIDNCFLSWFNKATKGNDKG